MSGFAILDLVAGMIFIYFLLSIINNSLFEIVAAVLKLRARHLETWIRSNFANEFCQIVNHPTLSGASKSGKSSSYMNSKQFTSAFIEIVCKAQGVLPTSLENIRTAISASTTLPESLKNSFLLFIAKAEASAKLPSSTGTEFDHFFLEMQDWYDSSMQRLTGKLKRHALVFTFFFGVLIAAVGNIDSIAIMNHLYSNPEARRELAAGAYAGSDSEEYQLLVDDFKSKKDGLELDSTQKGKLDSLSADLDSVMTMVTDRKHRIDTIYASLSMSIPMGWENLEMEKALFKKPNDRPTSDAAFWLRKVLGLLITVLAMCLGAPFWFDVLSKVANLRTSLKPKES